MTRQQLLWLFIWIFIFFLIFCLWNKLQNFTATIPKTTTTQASTAYTKKMHFKVLKDENSVTLSGIVASQEAKSRLIDAYGKVFYTIEHEDLHIDDAIKEDALLDFFTNFADNFSHFNSGYLAYNNGTIEIDGLAEHNIVKHTLEEQIASLNNVKVDNNLIIQPSTIEKENITTTENISIMSALDVQNALDVLLKDRRVQFLYARDILTSNSRTLVDKISTLLQKNRHIKIEIAGHTDSDGTKKNNLRLSKMRAESIKRYLITKEIEKKRLRAVGYGESKPLVSNKTLKDRQINRRVEFKVIGE